VGGVEAQWEVCGSSVVRAPDHGCKGPEFKSWHLQRLGLLAKSCNPATGGPEQGIAAKDGLYNLDGIYVETCLALSWRLGRSRTMEPPGIGPLHLRATR
jgi:hypothetical protein